MDFGNLASNKYWIPYIYARPHYIIVATPFGSQHVPLPLEDFLVAVAFTVLSSLVVLYLLCPRRYCCCCCCCNRKCTRTSQKNRPLPRPVLIITDIGRDIDDTLAFLTLQGLLQQHKAQLVGVVTSGGQGEQRARVVRRWLRRFGLRDEDVPIAFCTQQGQSECYLPKDTPLASDASLSSLHPGDLILATIEKYGGALEIVALAPLTPLAQAMQRKKKGQSCLATVQQGIKMLHIQGNCSVDPISQRLMPDYASFNLREDVEASKVVFEKLQDFVPFRLVGKHAAYQVSLGHSDFAAMDQLLGSTDMMDGVRENVSKFRQHNPVQFRQVYGTTVDQEQEQEDDGTWFEKMTTLSHPYDPLCVVAAFHPTLFRAKKMTTLHRAIGNTKESVGVINPIETKKVLLGLIRKGLTV